MEDNYQKYAWFKEKKTLLANLLADSSNIIQDLSMNQFAANLRTLSNKVDNETFKIQIVGTFKNGKSTFINALLSEDILPTRPLPCTAVINEVKYGEEKRAVLHFRNPLPTELISTIPEATMAHMKKHGMKNIPPMEIEYDRIDDYVVIPIDGDPEEISYGSPYKSVELFYPSPLLKEGVEIIDSPGLNEADERTAVTIEYLDRADAVIFLLDATKACSQDEMSTIEMLSNKGFDDIFFVVNRFDLINREKDRNDIKRFVSNKVSSYTNKDIFYISALQGLDGKVDGDEELYGRSGMGPFEESLTEFLTEDKGRIKLAQPARELKNILSNEALYKSIPSQRKQLSTNLDVLKARYQAVQPQIQSLENSKQQLKIQFELKIERAQAAIKHAIIDEFRTIANMIPTWIQEYEPKATIRFATKKAVAAVKDEILAHVEDKVKAEFSKWSKDVLTPLIQQKAEDIFESSEKDLNAIFQEIDNIQTQVSGQDVDSDGPKGWMRVAGVATAYLGFGSTGGNLMNGNTSFGAIAKSLATDIGVFTGLALLGLTNPVFILGAIVVLAYQGLVKGGKDNVKKLKEKMATSISGSIVENAPKKAEEAIAKVSQELNKLVDATMQSIDANIDSVKSQSESILKDMNEGQQKVDERKQMLDRSEAQLQDICKKLDELVFQLAGL